MQVNTDETPLKYNDIDATEGVYQDPKFPFEYLITVAGPAGYAVLYFSPRQRVLMTANPDSWQGARFERVDAAVLLSVAVKTSGGARRNKDGIIIPKKEGE